MPKEMGLAPWLYVIVCGKEETMPAAPKIVYVDIFPFILVKSLRTAKKAPPPIFILMLFLKSSNPQVNSPWQPAPNLLLPVLRTY
jgi:hypothetical protein